MSLTDIAALTNVKVELWEDMERNDFSRWPEGVYARTWVRSYAEAVGVDPDRAVDDFCRWFPQGDRRTERTLRRQAELIGHDLAWQDDLIPEDGDRRAPVVSPRKPTGIQAKHVRLVAAACDLCAVSTVAMTTAVVLQADRWSALGVIAPLYYSAGLALLGCTPAVWVFETYARDPGFYRRGDAMPFRRLRSSDIRTNVANAEP